MLRSINASAARRLHAPTALPRISPLSSLRAYTAPSPPRAKPTAMAVETDYAPPAYMTTPKREPAPHKFNPSPEYPRFVRDPVRIPAPLPSDVRETNKLNAELYKPTTAIDTVSMLSICSSRPEFVPRAYQIFNTLLTEAEAGRAHYPNTEVWANVVQGVAQLCKDATTVAGEKVTQLWRYRTTKLIHAWEKLHGNEAGEPALDQQGIQIYRAWFAALIKVNAPLDPIIPYIQNPEIGLTQLLSTMHRDDMDRALDQLKTYSVKHSVEWLEAQVDDAKGLEREKREIREREVVPEVSPVLEKAKAPKKRALSTPEVRAETTPSASLPQARFTITNLRNTLETINSPMTAYNRQMALERASYAAAEADLAHAAQQLEEAGVATDGARLKRNVLQGHMHRWHRTLTEYLEKDISEMTERVMANEREADDPAPPRWSSTIKMKDKDLMVYLNVLPPKRLALITILELMRMVGSGGIVDGMKTLRGMLAVGRAVEAEHRADIIRSVAGADSNIWAKALDPQTNKPSRTNIAHLWSDIGREVKAQEMMEPSEHTTPADALRAVWTPPWSQMVQMSVGSYLIEALLKNGTVTRVGKDPKTGDQVTEEQAAFSHGYEYVRGKKLGVIRLNPAVAGRLAHDSVRQVIHPKHLPMLVPPRPWNQWNDGAYLATPVQVMRFKDSLEQVNYMREASKQGHLEPVFHGLDVLSSTPWRINRNVFETVLKAWNSGDAIGDIPASVEKSEYELPEKPKDADTDPAVRVAYHERMKAVLARQRKDHGERCKFNYNLEIARSYLNDTFYIPHNMDFRGRAYPVPPHLSPVGDDLCRGLLTFGQSKPLGKSGLKWLQIHLANVYGFDKASFEERAQFARDHEKEIFESADDPLGGSRWWLNAEDPWQCLATCFELAAALRSPNPELFESSLPIHQDGTCNGMQHYAALGGDVRGAKAVNLEKGDRPADIYTGVADLVNKSIAIDRENNVPMALLINGELGRKVVKQTVMTTVYGVTFIGAREQIARQLVARGGIAPEDIYAVSAYVARKVLASIGDLFSGARAIQDWLTLSARLIARSIPPERLEAALEENVPKSRGKAAAATSGRPKRDSKSRGKNRIAKELMTAVVWTTPLGLPVVQPYRKEMKKQIMTSLQTVYIHDPNQPSEVSPMKQSTAFPPNYIHSLDATHMLLTAVKCNQSGITFASVHDSYWTHASTIESMSETIRDTFIHLHSQNLVGELRDEFLDHYGDHCIPVSNAKLLSSAAQKRAKNLAAIQSGEKKAGPMVYGSRLEDLVEREPPTASSSSSAAVDAADPTEDDSDGPTTVAAGSLDTDGSVEAVREPTVKPGEEGLSADELAELRAAGGPKPGELPEIVIDGQRFVRFRDVLPPAPPRGQFDVERIRDSAYFFS